MTDEHIADVLKNPLARVNFEYFREKLGVLQIEVPSKGKWWVCDPFWHDERITFLPWLDVRADPFCHGARIGSFPCWIWMLSHSDKTVGLVPTWSDIRAIAILWMEVPGQLLGILSLGLRAILIWLCDVFSHDQIWVHGYSDVIEGCVPTWSDIRDVSILLENGGTWSVTRNPQPVVESLSSKVAWCVPAWLDVSAEPF